MLYSGQTVFLKSTDNAKVLCKQINVITARKLYEKGVKIWMHPCKLTINNCWQVPYHFQKKDGITECFDSVINAFNYYNCDKERGERIIFFAECDTRLNLIIPKK